MAHDTDLIRYEQASEILGIPKGTLYTWVRDQRIPHVRLGPRTVRFSRRELDAWVRDNSRPGSDEQVTSGGEA